MLRPLCDGDRPRRGTEAVPVDLLLGTRACGLAELSGRARDVPPQQIALEIVSAEGVPVENGIQRGGIDVRVVAQASPRIAADAWRGDAVLLADCPE